MTDREKIEAVLDAFGIIYNTNPRSIVVGNRRFHFTTEDEVNRITDYKERKTWDENGVAR